MLKGIQDIPLCMGGGSPMLSFIYLFIIKTNKRLYEKKYKRIPQLHWTQARREG